MTDPAPVAPPAAVSTPGLPRVAVVMLTRTAELFVMHVSSHHLYTDPSVLLVVVDTSDAGDDDVKDTFDEIFWDRPALYLDAREGSELTPRNGKGEPARFYGNFCNLGAREAMELHRRAENLDFQQAALTENLATWKHGGAPEFLVFANDDTVVGPWWLETMLEDFKACSGRKEAVKKPLSPLQKPRGCGLLGARSNQVTGPQSVFDMSLLPYGVTGEMVFPYPRIVTFFALCKASDFFRVGGFDEELPAWNFSDDVISLRFLKAGMLNWVSRAFIFHAGSQSFARRPGADEERAAFYQSDLAIGEAFVKEKYPDTPAILGQVLGEWYFTD